MQQRIDAWKDLSVRDAVILADIGPPFRPFASKIVRHAPSFFSGQDFSGRVPAREPNAKGSLLFGSGTRLELDLILLNGDAVAIGEGGENHVAAKLSRVLRKAQRKLAILFDYFENAVPRLGRAVIGAVT